MAEPRIVTVTSTSALQYAYVDSFPGLLQVLIYNQSSTNSFPGLLQALIWNLKMVDGNHLLIDLS